MMKTKSLDDLEMFELLQLAYPEKFPDDDDETWAEAQEFADEICGWEDVADLLGRVVTLAMPLQSPLTGKFYHALGRVSVKDAQVNMVAAVRRLVASATREEE